MCRLFRYLSMQFQSLFKLILMSYYCGSWCCGTSVEFMKNCILHLVLMIGFASDNFTGSESSGVEVVVIISGGTSATPISVMVSATGLSPKGKSHFKN